VESVTTEQFRQLYAKAPQERQLRIRRAYRLWTVDPRHPSLRFKKLHKTCQSIQPEWILIGEWSVSSGMTPLFDSGLVPISRMRSYCDPCDWPIATKVLLSIRTFTKLRIGLTWRERWANSSSPPGDRNASSRRWHSRSSSSR
jgi:hypothetical protein